MSDDVFLYARDLVTRLSNCLGAVVLGVQCALEAAVDGLVPRKIYNEAVRELRMAEAILRRMALLIAVRMNITPLPVCGPVRPRAAPSRKAERKEPAHRLSLFDPWGSAPTEWPAPGESRRGHPAAGLARRLALVTEAFEDIEPMAQRMARWMQRRERRLAAPVGPRSRPEHCWICRIGRPPGLSRWDRGFVASALEGLQAQARAAYPP